MFLLSTPIVLAAAMLPREFSSAAERIEHSVSSDSSLRSSEFGLGVSLRCGRGASGSEEQLVVGDRWRMRIIWMGGELKIGRVNGRSGVRDKEREESREQQKG